MFTVSSSGSPPQQITQSAGGEVPSWSRDGRRIYFASDRSGQFQVWRVPASGEDASNAQQVTHQGGFGPALESADGKSLYYTVPDHWNTGERATGGTVWKILIGGGEAEPVLQSVSWADWDITVEGIYYVDQERSANFLSFDDGTVTHVANLAYPRFGAPAFSVSADGRWVLSAQVEVELDIMLGENFR